MKTVTKAMIVLGMAILVGLSGCGKSGGNKGNGEKSIVGKWQQIEVEREPQIIEFLKEERVLIYDLKDINKKEEVGLPGDYRFVDEKRIRMNVALFGPIDAQISPSGDEITLTNPFGKIEKYQRFDDGDRPSVKSDRAAPKQKLSRKETQLVGKYVGQMADGEQISFELKTDGICLIGPDTGPWEVKWVSKNDAPYAPYIGLQFYNSIGDRTSLLYAGDSERPTKITRGFARIDFWHSLCPDWKYRTLRRQEGAKPIKLDKVRDFIEETTYPGEVEVWSKYIGDSQILELKRIPNFAPSGCKRIRSTEGSYILYKTFEWKIISGNRIQLCADEDLIEFEIKDKTSADEKEGIIFVKQNSRSLFLVPVVLPAKPESTSQGKETSGLERIDPSEIIWVKCKNPNCGAEYQMSKKECFKYIEEHANPMVSTAPPLVCEKCGKESIYRAEKCGNSDCGLIFFRGTVPNDFPDRCPKCGYSVTEEQRKSRMSGISSSRVSSPSETTDPDPAWRSRRARHRY